MLVINLPGREFYDEAKEEFVTESSIEIHLEHSLVSLSKWEEIHAKPFLHKDEKSSEEILAYIQAMVIAPDDLPRDWVTRLSTANLEAINQHIEAKKTATWFNKPDGKKPSPQVITSELIYYWMTAFNIPFECETWHLSRLLTLIEVCNEESQPKKKVSKESIRERNRRLNEERLKKYNTKG